MTRYRYNTQLTPPAPFVHVSISHPVDQSLVVTDLPAQIDTAADYTVIPWRVVEQLQLVQLDQVPVGGFGGHISYSPTFLVGVTIRQLSTVMVAVLGSRDEPFVLLGRDVLNNFRILLDGPDLAFDITE